VTVALCKSLGWEGERLVRIWRDMVKGITRGVLVLGFFDVNDVGLYELLAVSRIGRASRVVQ
jgi:hypothetical protein